MSVHEQVAKRIANVRFTKQTKTDIRSAAAIGIQYDEACNRIFKNKEIIAPILQMLVPEYKDCTVEEVIRCIDADSISEDVPVEDIPIHLTGLPTEYESITEKTIRYDVHFRALNPVPNKRGIRVQLHIDLEVQNDYRPRNPKYPIVKRSVYYGVRELSAQLGSVTEQTNYADLNKVYSIWICNDNIPKKLQNTVTSYRLCKEDIIGSTDEPEENYDLLHVILIRRGNESSQTKESNEKIFDFLASVFQGELERIEKYTPVQDNETIRQEANTMTGLWTGAYKQGRSEGISVGLEQGLEQGRSEGNSAGLKQATVNFVKRMLRDGESPDKIAHYTECSIEQISQIQADMEQEKM